LERLMDYKAEIERTKAVFDMLLPYVQCDKDEFMATGSADAKLPMLMNGWANPWQACQELSKYAYWCARKGKIRSKISTEMSHAITGAMAKRKEL
jgi:hypothetical protein